MTAIKGIERVSWSNKSVLELDIDNKCIGNQFFNILKSTDLFTILKVIFMACDLLFDTAGFFLRTPVIYKQY